MLQPTAGFVLEYGEPLIVKVDGSALGVREPTTRVRHETEAEEFALERARDVVRSPLDLILVWNLALVDLLAGLEKAGERDGDLHAVDCVRRHAVLHGIELADDRHGLLVGVASIRRGATRRSASRRRGRDR